ncbi:hypothetical protein ACPV5R_19900 [Vibrio astriarenae]
MSIESLSNKGVAILRPKLEQSEKTLIVVGVARGGTSIVAGCLYHLGIAMGGATDPVYEDLRLSLAFEKQSKEKFVDVIQHYNSQNSVWAWKRPSTLHSLSYIARKVRNPHFIFVFRDMLSVANRNTLSMHKGVAWGLQQAQDDYKKIIKFIGKSGHPALLVSSEKVVKYKEEFVQALSDFSGVESSPSQVSAALEFITPNPTKYLEATRLTKARGQIDIKRLRTGVVKGWACYAVNHGVVQVEIVVNGNIVDTQTANRFEAQYKKPGLHPTGECGFEFDLKSLDVTPADKLEVRVRGDVVNLHSDDIDLSDLQCWLSLSELGLWVEPKGAVNANLLKTGLLRGWARTSDINIPAQIGIYVNGELFAQTPASIFRQHLQKDEIHPLGICGYEFNLKQHGVTPQDEVEVKVLNAKCQLHLKPFSFKEQTNWLTHQELKGNS